MQNYQNDDLSEAKVLFVFSESATIGKKENV